MRLILLMATMMNLMTCRSSEYSRPNILLIFADDLAFNGLGALVGEITTPNLDTLAEAGVRLSQFYVAVICSPTRSMLLSGTNNLFSRLGKLFGSLQMCH